MSILILAAATEEPQEAGKEDAQPPVIGAESDPPQGCTSSPEDKNNTDMEVTTKEEKLTGGEDGEGEPISTVATPGERTAQSLVFLDRAPNWRDMWNPRQSMSLTHTKGLLNAPGENNCFVNSAVQVLWHLDIFRRSFRLLSGHACMGNSCIFCALKVIFTQFQYSDQTSLPPDALRRALSKAFADQQRFQLGHMDDAAECFENILRRIHFHIANGESEDMCPALHCISHQKFAMNLIEQISCPCGATSEPLPFTQMVHYVSCGALVGHSKSIYQQHPGISPKHPSFFGQLLRAAASEGDMRNCPSNCGQRVQLRRTLTNFPDVVSIGLIWDSDRPSLDHIRDVVCCIGTTITLDELFHSVVSPHHHHKPAGSAGAGASSSRPSTSLHLVGVVCYYGKHYSTFFFHSKMKKWVYFDDATVREMGQDFDAVADKCCRGHYQPLLLLYANPEAEAISTDTAPQTTTKLPGYQYFNKPNHSGYASAPSSQPQSNNQAPAASAQPSYNYETSLRQNAQYQRTVTPNPDSGVPRHQTQSRRAFTPGPEQRGYDSDEDAGGFRQHDIAHSRQRSYINAIDNLPPTQSQGHYGHNTAGFPRARTLQESKTRMVGGASSSSSLDDLNEVTQNAPKSELDVPDHHDWTLSNSGQYRRPQVIPGSEGGFTKGPATHSASGQFVRPSSPVNSSSVLAKVNEIQRAESFNKKNSGRAADLVRYQQATGAHKTNVPRCIAREQRKLNYRQYGSTHDLASQDLQDSYSGGQDGDLKSSLKRTFSAENMDRLCGNLPEPTSHFHPAGPMPSQYTTESAQGYKQNQQPRQRKGSLGTLLDRWGDDSKDGLDDTYISRKAVESILSKQKKTLQPSKQPSNLPSSNPAAGPVGNSKPQYQQSLQVDIPDNESVGSRQDSGYRSNSSCGERRNSASSMSTASAESPSMNSNRGYPMSTLHNPYAHQRQVEPSRDAYGRIQYPGRQIERPPLPNKQGVGNAPANHHKEEDPYDYLPCHRGMPASQQGYKPSASVCQTSNSSCPPASSYQSHQFPPSSSHQPSSYSHPPSSSCHQSMYSQSSNTHMQFAQSNHQPVVHHSQQSKSHSYNSHQSHSQQGQSQTPDGECEALCLHAETLMETSTEKERTGDLNSALAICNQAVGVLQQAMNIENLSSETKVYSRMKHNTCVLRSRSLQRRLLMRKDSVDSGAEADQTSLSSMSTEADGHDLDSSTVEDDCGPGSKPSSQAYLNDKLRKEAIYASQYSSDSGYSSHSSDYAVPSGLRHSQTDGSLSAKLEDPYGTLPKRGAHKAVRSSSLSGSNDGVAYQAYLHAQKGVHEAGHGLHRSESLEHTHKPKGKMSKDDIRQLLISDFVNKNKVKGEGHLTGALHTELKDQLQQLNLKDSSPELQISHSRDSSTSSTHTLKAHSRENSLSSLGTTIADDPPYPVCQPQIRQPTANAPPVAPKPRLPHTKKLTGLSSFVPTQEIELRTKNRRIQYVKPQTHPDDMQVPPPTPSEVVQLDRQNLQQHLMNQQQMSKTGPRDMSRPQKSSHTSSRPRSGEGLPTNGKHPQYWPNGPADWSATPGGEALPTAATTQPTTSESSLSSSNGEEGLVDPDLLPPPPPSLMYPSCCTCDRPDGGHSPSCGVPGRDSPDLPPPPPEHVLMTLGDDTSEEGSVCNQRRHSCPNVPPMVTEPQTDIPMIPLSSKTPKSILKKKSKSGKPKSIRKSPMKKSISFSDSVALIICQEDKPEEIDYVAYVKSLNKQMRGGPPGQEKKGKPEARTGYDSDFDDDTSDSVSSVDANNETAHCNLCQKKMVEALEVYCQDCHSYMARFQPGQAQS